MRARSGWLKGLNPTVALVSKGLVLAFLCIGILFTDQASAVFTNLRDTITVTLSWYYIGLVSIILIVVIWLMLSRFGRIRLGDPGEAPDFSYFSWFAMLFAAGMGIGLVYWSIAEPMLHYASNPFVESGENPQAAQVAMRLTFFHWGLHPWAVYGLVALSLAYFSFRRGLPLSIRSTLYPIIGERIYGPIGHAVDILAVIATTFGVATSLGLGAGQINAGLDRLFGIDVTLGHQLVIVGVVTAAAVLSVASGLGRGIKFLSITNLWLSGLLVVAVSVAGPSMELTRVFFDSVGDYLQNVAYLSFWLDSNGAENWQASWTTFYWAWWISWSPFVGMFIARISRGRTIREFLFGVLVMPVLVTFAWLSVMGGTAIELEASGAVPLLSAVQEDVTSSLYVTLSALDFGGLDLLMAIIATLLVALYFITSSDSATLVVNTILSVGHLEPPLGHRILWGVSEGGVAATLLIAGGLSAMQAAAISAALPFSFILVLMTVGLIRSLHSDLPMEVHERPSS